MCTRFSLDTIVSKDRFDPFQRVYSVGRVPSIKNPRVNTRSETIPIVLNAYNIMYSKMFNTPVIMRYIVSAVRWFSRQKTILSCDRKKKKPENVRDFTVILFQFSRYIIIILYY